MLVSLSPSSPVEDELTIPEGWLEECVGAPSPSLPGPVADELVFRGPEPAARAATVQVTRTAEPSVAAAHELAAPVLTELGITVRCMVGAILTLLMALVLAAAGIAATPIADLITGETPSTGGLVLLGFSLATAAVAVSGLRYARPLLTVAAGLDVRGVDAGRTGTVPVRARVPAWRRVLGRPGLPEALLSGLGFGAFYVCISRAGASAGHWPMISARSVSVVLFTVVALATSTAVVPERGTRRFVVVAGVLDAVAAVLFVLATNAGLLSIGAVLASLYPAVTVLLARVHGRERIAARQFAGLGLALAAVALLAA